MKRVLLAACFAAICFGQQGKGAWEVYCDNPITSAGHLYHLRGHAELRGGDMVFSADQIDYDEDKAVIHLSGHVTIETKSEGTLHADEADYNDHSGEITLKLKLAPAHGN